MGGVTLRVARGHFATPHSHVNYLIDFSTQKVSLSAASATAEQLARRALGGRPVDAILCLDGMLMIGTCLAQRLSETQRAPDGSPREIFVLRGEMSGRGKVIFQDSLQPMVDGKNVLVLMTSLSTGKTAARGIESIQAYGGQVVGIAAIFSLLPQEKGVPVYALFDRSDLPDYQTYEPAACPLCQNGLALNGRVNSFGYSIL